MKLFKKLRKEAAVPTSSNDQFFADLREKDFSRLEKGGHTYLDFTGGNLYAESQIEQHMNFLKKEVYGNPHSVNPTSMQSTRAVEETRKAILEYFRATEDYICVFTANASNALKIVGECYPFDQKGHFMLLSDNHNSVNGIREFCLHGGGSFEYIPIRTDNLGIDESTMNAMLKAQPEKKNKLFAFPAQSNVSGIKHSLDWIKKANAEGWDVLLDAAAFVPSSRLDLSVYKPDFVSVSFYKIFGYPTGLGCLFIHKNKFHKLRKPWFAGGTVSLVTVKYPDYFLAEGHERFEDGTLNYLDIPALKIGLDYIKNIGIERISDRVSEITAYLIQELKKLKHSNGHDLVQIFGPKDLKKRGGTVIFNVFDQDGKVYPFYKLEEEAAEKMLSLRTGCFCNPGIDETNHCLTAEELSRYFIDKTEINYMNVLQFMETLRGAVRVSVGYISNREDIDKLIQFLLKYKDISLKNGQESQVA
ncbi:MAG: aminotransferase class V-fold PLP-dependent enzyme [Bacteroidetes bacterium]|nr:aminotransferase class V-fold PLP-dependent enzyme [Bacteroidota bacterium]